MPIQSLNIAHFRNISAVELSFSPNINIIFGENGSGKTSLLEAIYYIAMNRSFRSHLNQRIVQQHQDFFTLFARFDEHTLGIERQLSHKSRVRLDNEDIHSILPVLQLLPIQLIDSQSFNLLDGGPEIRRQFLDWGVFHVEHSFASIWSRYQKILKQRNSAIRQRLPINEIIAWDNELAELAQAINSLRHSYIDRLLPLLNQKFSLLIPNYSYTMTFIPGWDEGMPLQEVLRGQLAADCRIGYTQSGAHRADIKLMANGIPLKDFFSRGQQKLAITLMQISQGVLLQQLTGKTPIYLVDDLAAELDETRRKIFVDEILACAFQFFITVIDPNSLPTIHLKKTFHVEHGEITEI